MSTQNIVSFKMEFTKSADGLKVTAQSEGCRVEHAIAVAQFILRELSAFPGVDLKTEQRTRPLAQQDLTSSPDGETTCVSAADMQVLESALDNYGSVDPTTPRFIFAAIDLRLSARCGLANNVIVSVAKLEALRAALLQPRTSWGQAESLVEVAGRRLVQS